MTTKNKTTDTEEWWRESSFKAAERRKKMVYGDLKFIVSEYKRAGMFAEAERTKKVIKTLKLLWGKAKQIDEPTPVYNNGHWQHHGH